MRVSVPASGGKPLRIASFACYTYVIFQVVGALTARIGATSEELQQTSDQGGQDGIQVNQANTTPPLGLWWKGDLFVMSNTTAFGGGNFLIVETPGAGNAAALPGMGVAA